MDSPGVLRRARVGRVHQPVHVDDKHLSFLPDPVKRIAVGHVHQRASGSETRQGRPLGHFRWPPMQLPTRGLDDPLKPSFS